MYTSPLVVFCDAIREKKNWYHKILDRTRNLGEKWTAEALEGKLLHTTDDVSAAIQELEDEARRIILVDFTIPRDFHSVPAVFADTTDADSASFQPAAVSRRIHAPNLIEDVGVYVSDGLVPVDLHRDLVLQLDALATREPLDFHPGSYGKVQNFIHPSLYPLVLGASVVPDASKVSALPRSNVFSTEVAVGASYPIRLKSRYAWIPSVFEVSEDGKDAHIQSYINGLGPREHFPRLYRLIEKIFVLALPHFERTMNFKYQYIEPSSGDGEKDSKHEEQAEEKAKEESEAAKQLQHEEFLADPAESITEDDAVSFHGRNLKVIAANYHLKAGQEYVGSWHMEGMPHERIVASVIYYYDTDKAIIDEGLNLRKGREEEADFPTVDESVRRQTFSFHFRHETANSADGSDDDDDNYSSDGEKDYPSDWEPDTITTELPPFIPLGSVPTTNFSKSETTGRILSFPNWIQHQVGRLSVAEGTPSDCVAKRKILCFFLVDDDHHDPGSNYTCYHGITYKNLRNKVLTTSDIPYQVRTTNFRTLRILLPFVCQNLIGQNLPAELVQRILEFGDWGFTREEAEQYRRSLMKDRVMSTDKTDSRRHFSLCEH
ncbi:hypothetical protein C8J57DRAFT_1708995 [Mycena rebaudengoi]|nr:hypothetical protein C8J57DRAFT_1708995 [Mycena rebaudengoi]